MSNPLFEIMGGRTPFDGMMKQFENFKAQFSGDPKQQVQNLLNSGQMTQSQFNQLSQMATQFQNALKK